MSFIIGRIGIALIGISIVGCSIDHNTVSGFGNGNGNGNGDDVAARNRETGDQTGVSRSSAGLVAQMAMATASFSPANVIPDADGDCAPDIGSWVVTVQSVAGGLSAPTVTGTVSLTLAQVMNSNTLQVTAGDISLNVGGLPINFDSSNVIGAALIDHLPTFNCDSQSIQASGNYMGPLVGNASYSSDIPLDGTSGTFTMTALGTTVTVTVTAARM